MLRTVHSKGDRLDIGGILKVCGQRNCLRNVPVLWTLTNDWSTAQPSVGLERKEAWWLNEKKIKILKSWRRVGPEIKKRQYGLICIISLSWSSESWHKRQMSLTNKTVIGKVAFQKEDTDCTRKRIIQSYATISSVKISGVCLLSHFFVF